MAAADSSDSLIHTLDAHVPKGLREFDAFPKLPSTYQRRSASRGVLTFVIGLLAFVLLLNDIGEFLWGWPDFEFGVDHDRSRNMNVNVDMIVNMPCGYLSVDLRDAVGDRLYLSSGFRRDGTLFDIGSATTLLEHQRMISAQEAIAASRKSRSVFAFFKKTKGYKPTYNMQPDGKACRIYGSLEIKRVTANLHVTTLGHGYESNVHVDHTMMNLSHVITEFSFGPFFPEITQPLDNSLELTDQPFIAYQYFLHVVPTIYIAPRSKPLRTAQYSVTHYTRELDHGRGTPGIFFKFDMDPLELTIHQRTTGPISFLVRCIGVIGGLFTCLGYAIKVGGHAVDAVVGPSDEDSIVDSAASGVNKGKWRGGHLTARSGSHSSRVVRQGNGWVVEGAGSPSYGGSLAGTPATPYSAFSPAAGASSPFPSSPAPGTPSFGPPPRTAGTPGGPGLGFGTASPGFGPRSASQDSRGSAPGTPAAGYAYFPPTPSAGAQSFGAQQGPMFTPSPHPASSHAFGAQQRTGSPMMPPPQRARHASNASIGSIGGGKKDD